MPMRRGTKNDSKRIRTWPEDERPRERLLSRGAHDLTDTELVAILLRVGVRGKSAVELGHELLKRFGSVQAMMRAPLAAWQGIKGLGNAKSLSCRRHSNLAGARRFHKSGRKRSSRIRARRRITSRFVARAGRRTLPGCVSQSQRTAAGCAADCGRHSGHRSPEHSHHRRARLADECFGIDCRSQSSVWRGRAERIRQAADSRFDCCLSSDRHQGA